MKANVSSRFSEWLSMKMINLFALEKTLNSTSDIDIPTEFVIDINDESTITAFQKPVIQLIPPRTPNWEKAERDILTTLNWQSIQVGESTEAENVIEDLIDQTSVAEAMDWVYDLFLSNAKNTLLACTLIHALSHIEYERVYPKGPMMAMAMFSADDKRMVGYAIKAFSNWNAKDSLKYLCFFGPEDEWAQQELEEVKKYIQDNGDELDDVLDEKNHDAKVDTRTA